MSRLYGRQFKLILAGGDGHALDFSDLHVSFTVRQWESATPNTADCRIYNLSAQTGQRIGAKEFDRLIQDLTGVKLVRCDLSNTVDAVAPLTPAAIQARNERFWGKRK